MKKILMIGSAGTIGTALRNRLVNDYQFRYFDLVPTPEEEDVLVGSIADLPQLVRAMEGVDTVIHLASHPGFDQSWEQVNREIIGGSYNVFEAAHQAGVRKVIYASSTSALGWNELSQDIKVRPDMPYHPNSFYGISKATAEMLGRYYSENFGLSVICIRIGAYDDQPVYLTAQNNDIMKGFCDPDDLAQIVEKVLQKDDLGFQIFYGVSDNTGRIWDIENSKKILGYKSKMNSEYFIRPAQEKGRLTEMFKAHAPLVKAAVLEGSVALENWQAWLDEVEIETTHLETISFRTLPLVYENLSNAGLEHPLLKRLKGVYRRSWLENQFSIQEITPLIGDIHAEGIPLLLLDDLTSILSLYEGQGIRRLFSLDLMVKPEDVDHLIAFLRRKEIWPRAQLAENYMKVETPLAIWSPFKIPFTICWRPFNALKTGEEVLSIWDHANRIKLNDIPVYTLDLESHFLRLCLRTVSARFDSAYFALMDVAWMLSKSKEKLDWGKVIELAKQYHLALPVVESIESLKSVLDLSAAETIYAALNDFPTTWIDRQNQKWLYPYRRFSGPMTRLRSRFLKYIQSPKIPGALGPLRYLQYVWGVDKLRRLPKAFLRHLFKPDQRVFYGS